MWAPTKLASCHPSGAENFEPTPGFLEKLCTPGLIVRFSRSVNTHYLQLIESVWKSKSGHETSISVSEPEP
jgi:hypothetical protein